MDLTRKTNSFEDCSWFKFNNMELELGVTLKFYTSVAKGLKLKALGANSNVCRSYKGKTSRGLFWHPPIMNRFNIFIMFGNINFMQKKYTM